MKLISLFLSIIVVLIMVCDVDPALTKTYYWLDEKGVKHFTQTPPPGQSYYTLDGVAITPKKSASEKQMFQSSGSLQEIEGPQQLENSDALMAIQEKVMPEAKKGNKIAIHICRQTMYALGQVSSLDALPLRSAKPVSPETIRTWRDRVITHAEAGDPFYKTVLAILYLNGDGFPPDHRKTISLLKEAADQDYADALCKMGNLYHSGEIVGKDIKTALSYYERAGKKGSSIAWYNMGAIYFHGKGGTTDRRRAAGYYLKSARMNNDAAQRDLGLCYLRGYGVAENREEAVHWFRRAVANGNYKARVDLAGLGIAAATGGADFSTTENGAEIDRPRHFFQVEICSSCLEGIYRDIRICDLNRLREKLTGETSLMQSRDKMGWTPLTLAIASGCRNTVTYLLDNLADVNERHRRCDFSPLHIAVFTGQRDMVETLLAAGADINMNCEPPSDYYWYSRMRGTPLHTAMYNRKYDLVTLLLKRGADHNAKNADGRTLFEFAVDLNKRDRIGHIFRQAGLPLPEVGASVDELLSAISDCNATSTQKKGEAKVEELLNRHPELVKQKDENGTTPLHLACFYHMGELIESLVALGGDVNARNNRGSTPLHKISHDKDIAQFLIDQGAQLDAQNDEGQTPLHRIARYADVENARETLAVLIKNGATKYIQDSSGRTPYDIAFAKGHTGLAELLK
jgi:ankyrin repeat protein/TPR repeat protein